MSRREIRDLATALSRFPTFSGCRPDDLAALAAAGRVTTLPRHWTFLHEGTPADACYVLLDGEVRILVRGVECATLGPGRVLGELALLSASLRTATVVTSTPVNALRVDYPALSTLFRSHPQLRQSIGAAFDGHDASADQHCAAGRVPEPRQVPGDSAPGERPAQSSRRT